MTNLHQNGVYNAISSSEKKPYLPLVEQLDLMVRARYPLLYIIAVEEEPTEEVLQQVAASTQERQLLFWDVVRGWSDIKFG